MGSKLIHRSSFQQVSNSKFRIFGESVEVDVRRFMVAEAEEEDRGAMRKFEFFSRS